MKPQYFVGIDISKVTLDFAIINKEGVIEQGKIANTEKAVRALCIRLSKVYKCTASSSIFCAENMGLFSTYLLKVCVKRKIKICMENPLQIKRSMGVQRAKTDAIDALEIAKYASKNWQTLRLWKEPEPDILNLKTLSTLRKKLIKLRVVATTSKKVEEYYLTKKEKEILRAYTVGTEDAIQKDLVAIEAEMSSIIENNEKLSHLSWLVTSVPRIGNVIARELLIMTNAFDASWTSRKFNCFCGIAPFERTSGTSVKGRPHISSLANKGMKSLLHMAAIGSIKGTKKTFLKLYYERKVKEGKHKMSVLNAIKNKLVRRIFACVRKNKCYTEIIVS